MSDSIRQRNGRVTAEFLRLQACLPPMFQGEARRKLAWWCAWQWERVAEEIWEKAKEARMV